MTCFCYHHELPSNRTLSAGVNSVWLFCQAQLSDKLLGSDFFFVGHENYNIGQFSCQSWLYRPFIDHFHICRYKELVDILLQMFAMQFRHTVDEDVCVLSFSGVNERLYVFNFVFYIASRLRHRAILYVVRLYIVHSYLLLLF